MRNKGFDAEKERRLADDLMKALRESAKEKAEADRTAAHDKVMVGTAGPMPARSTAPEPATSATTPALAARSTAAGTSAGISAEAGATLGRRLLTPPAMGAEIAGRPARRRDHSRSIHRIVMMW